MPLSVLTGRTPRKGEPVWLPEDLEVLVELDRWREQRCPSCGTVPDDWVDPETGKPHDHQAWAAMTDVCHGCRALDRKALELPKDEAQRAGVKVRLADAGVVADLLEGKARQDQAARDARRNR